MSMLGSDLWGIFLGANVPDAELLGLGDDIGHKREVATAHGQKALLKVCLHAASLNGNTILFSPSQLFTALKMWMPGGNPLTIKEVRTRLLEAIGADYEARRAWPQTTASVREYFGHVGDQLPSLPTQPPSAGSGGHKDAVPASSVAPVLPGSGAKKTAVSTTVMGADDIMGASDGSPSGLTPSQFSWLRGTVERLSKKPKSVSDNHLAAARNFAARGNLSSTLGYLDRQIELRGSGAQTEEATSKPRGMAEKNLPIWPFALGFGGLATWLFMRRSPA